MTFYKVGKIVNTHGLRGEVRVISVTDFADDRYRKGQALAIQTKDGGLVDVTVQSHRRHKNFDIISFAGKPSINDVELYKGLDLLVSEDYLDDLENDEFYYHEIIGLPVYQGDQLIGKIKEILELGSNDVWVVQRQGQKDTLLPYIDDVILSVNVKGQRVEIADIEGLLD